MPTKIIFQIEAIKNLTSLAINLGDKPCIITGKQSSKINGALSYLLEMYSNAVVLMRSKKINYRYCEKPFK
jgi:hypothetical protein